jgi:hypothetical protein
MTGSVTTTNIHIVSETGAIKDYVLKTYAAVVENRLYFKRWPDILGINANPFNNGGYEVLAYRWFRHDGSPAGNKGYIRAQSSADYAEIQTVQTDGWHRVCGIPQTLSSEKITVYPNPVPYGEKVQIDLPEQYVGGTLNIYNITGAVVKSGIPLSATNNNIDVSSLGTGIYLFNIADKDGNRQSVKIIVE